jgi:hypothetical protein
MKRICCATVIVIAFFVVSSMRGVGADVNRERDDASPFDKILVRVAALTDSEVWREKGFEDKVLESEVLALINQVERVTKHKKLELPVTFAKINAGVKDGPLAQVFPGGLFVDDDIRLPHAANAIILADRSVRISHAHNCVIVSRGAVDISHGSNNVIVAGHFVHVSHDASLRPDNQAEQQPSIIVSGSQIDISHARNTVCIAPDMVSISHAHDVTLVNVDRIEISHDHNPARVSDESNMFPRPMPRNGDLKQLTITQLVIAEDGAREDNSLVVVVPGMGCHLPELQRRP